MSPESVQLFRDKDMRKIKNLGEIYFSVTA
jgi:hypothetical protein